MKPEGIRKIGAVYQDFLFRGTVAYKSVGVLNDDKNTWLYLFMLLQHHYCFYAIAPSLAFICSVSSLGSGKTLENSCGKK